MRIECPDCSAAYDVPEHMLAGRKVVRCARCGGNWSPGAPEPQPVAEEPRRLDLTRVAEVLDIPQAEPTVAPAAEPSRQPPRRLSREPAEYSAMQRLAEAAEPPPASMWPRIAWALSVVVLVLLIWGAFNWRGEIMQAWPPSTRAYAALGLIQPAK